MSPEKRIYMQLLKVPKGKITTYGELAKAAGIKNGQRFVGRAMNKNPYPALVPCHRVILASGEVGGYAYGKDVKKNMLEQEGVSIRGDKVEKLKERMHRF